MVQPERLRANKNVVYLVRGKDAGRDAWHYLAVDKLKLPLFLKALKSRNLDAAQYGTVLHSGWGEQPPKELAEKMKKPS